MNQKEPSSKSASKASRLKAFFRTPQGTSVAVLLFMVVCIVIAVMPRTIRQINARRFARPLFEHSVPENAIVLEKLCQQEKNDDGVMATYAAVIVQTTLSEEDLLEYYSDTEYPAARKGDTVTLNVYPVADSDLSVLEDNADDYRSDGGNCYYIYLYSGTDALEN